jgi:putative redox protein
VLRFDFTGLGNSDGDFANTTFSSNIDDLVAAAGWLRKNHAAPELLVGHSLGGAAVLRAASQIAEVRAVATIGAPFDPTHVRSLLRSEEGEIVRDGKAQVELGGRTFTIKKEFLDDLEKNKDASFLGSLRCAKLLLHSPTDQIVGIENAGLLYDALKHPKSFVSLDGADHLLSHKEDSTYAAAVLSTWASRYLSLKEEAASTERGEGTVLVEGHAGSFRTRVAAGNHVFMADEPKGVGGSDMGPSPYDLLLAALGVCTSMTLHLYAKRKGWALRKAEVSLHHEKVHQKDGEHCDGEVVEGLQALTRIITVVGDLDDKQVERLKQIANKCPVHQTLLGPLEIPTTLKMDEA